MGRLAEHPKGTGPNREVAGASKRERSYGNEDFDRRAS